MSMNRGVVMAVTGLSGLRQLCMWSSSFLWQSVRSISNTVNMDLRKTALYDYHVSCRGKMGPYAGWSMPMAYDLSVSDSVLHTRKSVSLFDVSHMLQMKIFGVDSADFLETVSPVDLRRMNEGTVFSTGSEQENFPYSHQRVVVNTYCISFWKYGCLSVYTNETGGIIDDCIITKTGEESYYVVSNASCAEKDIQHLNKQLELNFSGRDVNLTVCEDMSLIALQGPKTQYVLSHGVKNISNLYFMESAVMDVFGIPNCRVTRCGYTGEDGVEISVPTTSVVSLVSKLTEFSDVKWAGLGTRDVLRLEAGLCLYGNDISENTTPIEAGLAWCISPRRRKEGNFIGCSTILEQLENKPSVRRIGIISKSKRPIRQGAIIQDAKGCHLGHITSGAPSPSCGAYIAMAYVPQIISKRGTKLKVIVRNATLECTVVKLPFVSSKYYVQ